MYIDKTDSTSQPNSDYFSESTENLKEKRKISRDYIGIKKKMNLALALQ
jgi:hypothetical protein